jgi:hypothetical protein
MAVTLREAVVNLLEVLDREGGFRAPRDQVVIAQVRTLVAAGEERIRKTFVRCNAPSCPSRLELDGDWCPADAATIAKALGWQAIGEWHACPACRRTP